MQDSITLKPMTEEDYKNSGGQVTQGFSKNIRVTLDHGLNSTKIFGDKGFLTEDKQTAERDNVRAYIPLQKPYVNFVLAGSRGTRLQRILGISARLLDDIMKFEIVWSISRQDYVTVDEIDDPNDMLANAEILKMLIDKFDIEEGIKYAFRKKIAKKFIYKAESPYLEVGDIVKGNGEYHLLGDWYLNPRRDANWLDKLEDFMHKECIAKAPMDNELAFLLNMKNKDFLNGCISEFITVTPPNMRPSMAMGQDTCTIKYAEVITANDILKNTLQADAQPFEIIERYKVLLKKIKELLFVSDPKNHNYVSFAEKLKGKKALIRGGMLSKRADYSGRSVIVVNPKLSIDQCGIPKEMIPKLFRYHHLKNIPSPNLNRIRERSDEDNVRDIVKYGILDRVPIALNRQPTLHTLSYRAFFPIVSSSKAIELHPLVCPGYNADFDGDTMGCHVPLSDDAINEMTNLMLATRCLFVPASGKPTIVPRQEIVYGLNVATKEYVSNPTPKVFKTVDEVAELVMQHKLKVYETITVGSKVDTAGSFAFRWTLPEELRGDVITVTKKTINNYINELLRFSTEQYKLTIDRMVQLGFRLAKLYAPTVTILNDLNDEFLKDPFKEFHKNMEEVTKLYQLGLEDEDTFNFKYGEELEKVNNEMKVRIKEGLGPDNGYLQLVESGARGDINNLIQIYGFKGRIKKSDCESFNAVIENSFAKQLYPLEHLISAYGTRSGMIDKVQKTGDTGYADRLMFDGAADCIITSMDCGTKEGIPIRKSDISRFIKSEDDNNTDKINNQMFDIILGRYEAGTDKYIDREYAEHLIANYEVVTIRSPLTCKNPTCSKCYGKDLSIQGKAVVGLPIGYLAGQSIGEPGTQLTMRTFHKGGVAGKANVTSDFDRINAFIHVSDIRKKFDTYDPVAWTTGNVFEVKLDNESKYVTIGNDKRKIKLPNSAILKPSVEKGEGICMVEGDHYVKEVVDYAGIEEAQIYLLYLLYTTYIGKAEINIKHFETLISAMVLHHIVRTDRDDLKVGCLYNRIELLRGDISGTEFTSNIYGCKQIQLLKDSALNNIALENVTLGLARATALGTTDNLDTSMARLMLGMAPKLGTYYPNYIQNRLEAEKGELD